MPIDQGALDELDEILDGRKQAPSGHFLTYASRRPMIYGSDGPQRIYLDALLRHRGNHKVRNIEKFPKGDHPFISNYFLDWNDAGEIEGDWSIKRTPPSPAPRGGFAIRETARQDFTARFNVNAQSLVAASTKSMIEGIKKDNPKRRPLPSNFNEATFAKEHKSFAVRRACKYLIHDSIMDGRFIAYCLDDLKMEVVLNKTALELLTKQGTPSGRFKVPVCTSEIREIFRRWDRCAGKVIFFKDLMEKKAPWEAGGDVAQLPLWSAYALDRAGKLGMSSDVVQKITTQRAAGSHALAIGTFHAAGPSSFMSNPTAVWP